MKGTKIGIRGTVTGHEAIISGQRPRNELEAMLIRQMAVTHALTIHIRQFEPQRQYPAAGFKYADDCTADL